METSSMRNKGVLVIYTGGTIGSKPRDPDPNSPQVVVPWEELKAATPELQRLEERGFGPIRSYSFAKPLDSCNIGPAQWAEMANAIRDAYAEVEGFVILHGTDTMVYTASALSFMLGELGKPVIITGAQRSAMVDVRNDATQNFITALEIANPAYSGLPPVPEVCIYFGGKLLRGNRSIKVDTAGYIAYDSPNLEPLGEVGDRFVLNEKHIRPLPGPERKFHVRTKLDTHVTTLFMYPGLQDTDLAEKQLSDKSLKAAVVLAFGSGNIPTRPEFLDTFRKAKDRGLILANLSQCRTGPIELGIYDTSAKLLDLGFIAASDITLEAAQCKLMVLLGDPDISPDEAATLFQRDMAGEQSVSLFLTGFPTGEKLMGGGDPEAGRYRIPARQMEGNWDPRRIDRALLRFRGAVLKGASEGESADMRVFVDLDEGAEPRNDDPGYIGSVRKYPPEEQPSIVILDVTRAVRGVAAPGKRISFTLFLDTPSSSFSWKAVELALFVRETGE